METTRRSLAKDTSYRFFGTLTMIALALLLLGRLGLAAAVGILATLFNSVVYVAREQALHRIPCGRQQRQPKDFI